MPKQLSSALFFGLGGAVLAYVFAQVLLDFMLYEAVDYLYLPQNFFRLLEQESDLMVQVGLIFLFLPLAGAIFGAHFAKESLTKEGTSAFQKPRQIKKNRMMQPVGSGFVYGKTSLPHKSGTYLVNGEHPNTMFIGPTGSGKNTGFVFPTLLTFKGSTVSLDMKGENYKNTAPTRAMMGNKIYRFAPVDFESGSVSYNPMERIANMKSIDEVYLALLALAPKFLSNKAPGDWLNGAIQLFTALGLIAHQRGTLTLGAMYRVLADGGTELKPFFADQALAAQSETLQLACAVLAKRPEKTLGSYLSVLDSAGFQLWGISHVDKVTSRNELSFETIRKEAASIYFVVTDEYIGPLAGLIRLFFNELTATLHRYEPTEDEPHKVMIIMDEFHRLGHMEDIETKMTTIRSYGGQIAIVTQTLPKLDALYELSGRLSMEGNANTRVFLTPNEKQTIQELSDACGMTSKPITTTSKMSGLGQKTNASKRYERRPLMEPDDIRLMPLSDVLILTRGKDPIKVRSIKHFKDPFFMDLIAKNKAPGLALIEKQKKEQEKDFKVDRLEQRIEASERRNTLALPPVANTTFVQGEGNDQGARTAQPRKQPTTNDLNSVVALAHTVIAFNTEVKNLPPKEETKRLGTADAQKPRISPKKMRKAKQYGFAVDVPIMVDPKIDKDDDKAQVAAE